MTSVDLTVATGGTKRTARLAITSQSGKLELGRGVDTIFAVAVALELVKELGSGSREFEGRLRHEGDAMSTVVRSGDRRLSKRFKFDRAEVLA